MVKRFLIYSMDHNRPVKVLFWGADKYVNIRVTALEEEAVTYLLPGRKKTVTSPLGSIMSAFYARGDDGDTLKYASQPEKEEK